MTKGRQRLERHAMETSARGSSLADAQLWEDALAAFLESAAAFRSLRDSNPGHEADYDVSLAVDLNNIGTCLWRLRRLAEAITPLGESAQPFDARRQDDPGLWSGPMAGPLQTMAAATSSAGLHDQALAVSRHAVMLRRAADSRPAADPELAKALRMFAIVRSAAGLELHDALTAADEALGIQGVLVGDDPGSYLPEFCMTQNFRALVLDQLGRTPEAVAVRRWLATRPMIGLLPEGTARAEAMTLTFAAVTLIGQGEDQQAVDLLDSLVNQHSDPMEQTLRQPVAVALFNKGVALKHLGRRADEIAVYDEVWRRFGEDTDVQVRHQVASSLVNRGVTTNATTAYAQTLASAEEVLRRYSDDPAPELRIQSAKALYLKRTHWTGWAARRRSGRWSPRSTGVPGRKPVTRRSSTRWRMRGHGSGCVRRRRGRRSWARCTRTPSPTPAGGPPNGPGRPRGRGRRSARTGRWSASARVASGRFISARTATACWSR